MATSSSDSEAGAEGGIEQTEEDFVPDLVNNAQQQRTVDAQIPRLAMDKLSPPTSMQLTGNLADNWKRFKQRFNIYLAASGAGNGDEKLKANILLHVIGEDALDIFNSFQLDEANVTLAELMTKFEEYFVPTQNVTFERYKFFTHDQKQGVPFDQYLAELHTLSKTCEFGTLRDSLVRDRIVCGTADNGLRERLLRETGLTLDKCVSMCRTCLDPRDLNKAIRREHFKLPTREEIMAQFAGAKWFSKLDASSGFWQLRLDEESSKLCTFNTPEGRYRFLRLPYGIRSAPEVYHKTIHMIYEHIPGVETMMDDIIVWGTTREEHDKRLRQVLDKTREVNLKLNKDKCEFGVKTLTFVGDVVSEQGVKPDPKKTSAINNMERPTNKDEVRRFLGMVTYLAKFVPQLATLTTPLRSLLEQKNEWIWSHEQEQSFQKLKEVLTQEPVLKFYDPEKRTRISADASQHGLGAVLLQQHDEQWLPVAYASRALTGAESRYAQIEKELLASMYACERFHQYVYGQTFEVETDHKPLVSIMSKALSDCPVRIQRMLIRLQKYDVHMMYTKGKYMYTADTLSRAVDKDEKEDSGKGAEIQAYVDMILTSLPVTADRTEQIRTETNADETMKELKRTILKGWPENKKECPGKIQDFWNCRAELTVVDDIVLKGSKFVIPTSLRKQMLRKIHEGHLGEVKCKRRARDVMYWPRINPDDSFM
uniref:Gypsy retrotransposon integrase-like protein 1 n=1 Tax=Oryzias latipes TaxID=8090 RepID=A0A3P9HQ00_ORYLA